jgi:hypothetical protein
VIIDCTTCATIACALGVGWMGSAKTYVSAAAGETSVAVVQVSALAVVQATPVVFVNPYSCGLRRIYVCVNAKMFTGM